MINYSSFVNAVVTCILFYSGSMKGQSDDSQTNLQIYLPREVTVNDSLLQLGQVSVIRGEKSLVERAGEITLGRFSVPGQKIVVDRPTVLSRLASSGIKAPQVTLTGAEEITVKKQQHVIKGSEFVALAGSFLKENDPAESVFQFCPIAIPKDFVLPSVRSDITLSPRLVKNGLRNQAKVAISVACDGKEIGSCEVTFRLKFKFLTVVALTEIPAGSAISPQNVRIEETVSDYPEPANWPPPYGLIVRSKVSADAVIQPDMLVPAKLVNSIRRNETVVIRVQKPGFLITAVGKALQDGRAGECIKVRNSDSQRIILAKVNEDGTVEPTL